MKNSILAMLLCIVLTTGLFAGTSNERPLMRFPDVHEGVGLVVFVHGEDIWKAPIKGGEAVRLTIHDGEERFPKFSPDGKYIAFTGQYDGNPDVYVMDNRGGNITRLTFHPGSDDVVGWHPTKNKIIFRSNRLSFNRYYRLFTVNPDGTDIEPLILHEGVYGSYSPDGSKIAYNRVTREFRTWKRYRGGLAQDIFIYDFNTQKDKRVTLFRGTDRTPMWIGNKIYFASDRDDVLNIYAMDAESGKTEQLTFHTEYDARRPSEGQHSIIYELGGQLWLLDLNTNKTAQIPVTIYADSAETRPYIKKVDEYVTGIGISPAGNRALVVARGEVFTVPKKEGPTRNLTQNPGARDKDAAWSPDGKTIAYLSDADGEYNIYLIDAMGKGTPKQLTHFEKGYRHTLRWSPDGSKIAFADQTLTFFYIDVATKKITKVDKAEHENIDISLDLKPIYDFQWSPDSRFLAYSKMDADQVTKVYIYSLETREIHQISYGIFNDFQPVFSPCGEYLFFVSNRRFNPTYDDFEWEMVYKKMAGIYAVTLKKEGKPVLPFQSDEAEVKTQKTPPVKSKKKKGQMDNADKPVHVRIDFDGIAQRIQHLPLPRGNYRNISISGSTVYYLNADEGDFNRFEFRPIRSMDLKAFCLKEREEHTIIKGINAYELSADGSHIVYRQRNHVGILESSERDSNGKNLSLDNLKMVMEPLKEWKQLFDEAWRFERDFYYDPKIKGLDWPAMKEKYGKLIPYASCRQDIRYIIGELISELNTSHTYVFGGDHQRTSDYVNVGMLGADYEIDKQHKLYRFKKIYRVPDWSRENIPPLSGPGKFVSEGDYLLAVNGVPITADKSVYSYFQDLAGKQVTLKVAGQPNASDAREFTVKPLYGEYSLRYQDWVEHNRLTVDKLSNGQVGYIHFPDTFNGSAVEFPKYFYSQTRKKGLIVDGRFNGGGLDPSVFFARMDRPINSYWTRRYSHDQYSPGMGMRAHFVCLTNRYAGSGGDEFPQFFRDRGMGPIIGTRTWGGLVGVSMFIDLIDGSGLTAPDYRIYDEKGNWIIENMGVEPDIVVDLKPNEVAQGKDAQLMTGLEVLMDKIKKDPKPWPKTKPWPVEKLKTKEK